jgi:hypothetical protein
MTFLKLTMTILLDQKRIPILIPVDKIESIQENKDNKSCGIFMTGDNSFPIDVAETMPQIIGLLDEALCLVVATTYQAPS